MGNTLDHHHLCMLIKYKKLIPEFLLLIMYNYHDKVLKNHLSILIKKNSKSI